MKCYYCCRKKSIGSQWKLIGGREGCMEGGRDLGREGGSDGWRDGGMDGGWE